MNNSICFWVFVVLLDAFLHETERKHAKVRILRFSIFCPIQKKDLRFSSLAEDQHLLPDQGVLVPKSKLIQDFNSHCTHLAYRILLQLQALGKLGCGLTFNNPAEVATVRTHRTCR